MVGVKIVSSRARLLFRRDDVGLSIGVRLVNCLDLVISCESGLLLDLVRMSFSW